MKESVSSRTYPGQLSRRLRESLLFFVQGAILFFSAFGLNLLSQPEGDLWVLLLPKVLILSLLMGLLWALKAGKIPLSYIGVVTSSLLAFCTLSLSLALAWGWLQDPVPYLGMLMAATGLLYLDLWRPVCCWAVFWALAAMVHPMEGWSRQVLFLLGFQVVGAMGLGLRRREVGDEAKARTLRLQTEEILEQKALQAHKLEALNRLAGGVAHDFNNLLTVILGNLEFARNASAEDYQDALQQAELAARRAAEISAQLLAFSRKQVLRLRLLTVSEALDPVLNQAQQLWAPDLVLRRELVAKNSLVRVDASQFHQAILNVLSNAKDASGGRGEIVVRASEEKRQEQFWIVIEIQDFGSGMDPSTQSRVLEPFFTTKPVGQGSGLGLAAVDGIISQHRGQVHFSSKPGRGTSVKILLPVPPPGSTDSSSQSSRRPVVSQAVILLVDPDADQSKETLRSLKSLGFRVEHATSSHSALERVESKSEAYALAILPLLGSEQVALAQELQRLRPSLKVLYLGPWRREQLLSQGIDLGSEMLLTTPFSQVALGTTLQRMLKAG